jgi:predicted NAD/FAD-binding protein
MRIAIVGAGISGMGAAYLLHKNHDITLYEKEPRIGGHTRTLEVDYDGTKIPVDTGFIVCNDRNYPHLLGLFKQLGVAIEKSDMSFGISIDGGKLEWSAQSLLSVFGQRSNFVSPSFYKMLLDMRCFFKKAPQVLQETATITLGQLLDRLKLGREFREHFLLPMGGAIWSCPTATMLEFPAQTFVQFFQNHGLLTVTDQPQWYTVTGGSREYVKKLTAPFKDKIRENCGVTNLRRVANGVEVTDAKGGVATYDNVILACHADEALAMLKDADETERRLLGSFTYQPNQVVVHRDSSQMPKRRNCWASWIYLRDMAKKENDIAVTYWMNNLQNIDKKHPLFVTLNPITPPKPELVFNTHTFSHPVFTKEAVAAQGSMPLIQGKGGVWYCGAYQRYGFHEDGLMSAVSVATKLGATVPWA